MVSTQFGHMSAARFNITRKLTTTLADGHVDTEQGLTFMAQFSGRGPLCRQKCRYQEVFCVLWAVLDRTA